MSTDINVNKLNVNIMSKTDYEGVTPSTNELYFVETDLDDKANDNEVVKLSGNQTINGQKLFINELFQKSSTGDSTTPPVSDIYQTGYRLTDKNDVNVGYLQSVYATNGDIKTICAVSRVINGSPVYTGIGVALDTNGNSYTVAPTPSTEDNSTKIATTAFFNNKIQVVSSLPASPDPNVFYFTTS